MIGRLRTPANCHHRGSAIYALRPSKRLICLCFRKGLSMGPRAREFPSSSESSLHAPRRIS